LTKNRVPKFKPILPRKQGNRISKSEIENYFSGSEQVIWQAKSDDRNLFFGQNAQLWLSKVTGSSSAN